VISDLLFRLRALFGRRSVETELHEELRAHVEHVAAVFEMRITFCQWM
jgi:hypothetical protein